METFLGMPYQSARPGRPFGSQPARVGLAEPLLWGQSRSQLTRDLSRKYGSPAALMSLDEPLI